MNERIKQLALDAGIGFILWDDSGRAMIDNYTPEERLTKFAELIVRECDLYAKRNWEHGTLLGGDLLNYFGVKE